MNCSCRSDRVSSGNSVSSSCGEISLFVYGRRLSKRFFKSVVILFLGNLENDRVKFKGDVGRSFEVMRYKKDSNIILEICNISEKGDMEEFLGFIIREGVTNVMDDSCVGFFIDNLIEIIFE